MPPDMFSGDSPRRIMPEPPGPITATVQPRVGLPDGVGPRLAAPPPPAPSVPMPVGGDIHAPKRTHYVDPIYPAIARQARIGGIVIVDAIIGQDGSVKNAKVLRGNPLLDQAALDAVSQWTFTPTLLNGQPVEVQMSVTVTFQVR